jgi:hypothetical protein
MVMLCGRSQHKENLQGDVLILQQISALRRDLSASRKIGQWEGVVSVKPKRQRSATGKWRVANGKQFCRAVPYCRKFFRRIGRCALKFRQSLECRASA